MYDVVLSGYYGFGNSGDEALLRTIISDLRKLKPDISIAVLSNNPELTSKTHGVDAFHRMNILKIRSVLKKSGLLISGGGSLVQDATSSKSLFYYLGIIKLAGLCGTKVMIYANGVGPVTRRFNKWLTGVVLNKVDHITLREPDSAGELKNLGVTVPEITVTADPALNLLPGCDGGDIKQKLFGEKKVIAVSLRNWKSFDKNTIQATSEFTEYFEKKGYSVFLLPMQYSADWDICRAVSERTGCFILPDEYSVDQITGLLSCCEAVVGMRLHSVIYAAASEARCVGIVYDPKVESFMKYIGQDFCVDIKELTGDSLINVTEAAIIAKPVNAERFKELAFANAEIALKLLKK